MSNSPKEPSFQAELSWGPNPNDWTLFCFYKVIQETSTPASRHASRDAYHTIRAAPDGIEFKNRIWILPQRIHVRSAFEENFSYTCLWKDPVFRFFEGYWIRLIFWRNIQTDQEIKENNKPDERLLHWKGGMYNLSLAKKQG